MGKGGADRGIQISRDLVRRHRFGEEENLCGGFSLMQIICISSQPKKLEQNLMEESRRIQERTVQRNGRL